MSKSDGLSARAAIVGWIAIAVAGGCAGKRPAIIPPNASQAPLQTSRAAQWIHEESAKNDALEFLRTCLQHYLANVRDYRCKFHMRERSGAGLAQVQVLSIKFRESPYSVDMTWLENPAGARRISYVEGRWVKEGRQLALVEPSGLGSIVLPGGLKLDIHGKESH
jgi:hypothetical protein